MLGRLLEFRNQDATEGLEELRRVHDSFVGCAEQIGWPPPPQIFRSSLGHLAGDEGHVGLLCEFREIPSCIRAVARREGVFRIASASCVEPAVK